MIRLTRIGKFNVSNRVAVLAAITLFLTSFTGLSGESGEGSADSQTAQVTQQSSDGFDTGKERKLKFSLLIFGKG